MNTETINANYMQQYPLKEKKKKMSPFTVALCSIPLVDSFSKGIMQNEVCANGKLGSRLASSMKALKGWGAVLGCIFALSKIKEGISNKSEKMANFYRNHPIIDIIGDICLIVIGISAGKRAINVLKKEFPNANLAITNKLSKLKHNLDKSKFNNKTIDPMTKSWNTFANKSPKIANLAKGTVANAKWITFAGIMLASMLKPVNKNQD